ncbi:MAG: type II secretion system GspH family protein [Firmicutes bacterium]|nr:type II secretion system GspH family protein [Bacillota bacterium]
MSLVEIMVVLLLWMIVLGALYMILIQGSVIFKRGEKNVEAQQQAMLAMTALDNCMRESSFKSVMFREVSNKDYVYADFPIDRVMSVKAVCCLSAKDNNNAFIYNEASGLPMWQKYTEFYLVDQDTVNNIHRYKLYMKSFNPSGSGFPSPVVKVPESEWITNTISTVSDAKLIARNIIRIDFQDPSLNQIEFTVVSNVDLQKDGRYEESKMSQRVFFRN